MRVKSLSLSLVLCMLALFASCNPSKEINSKTTKKESTTQTTIAKDPQKEENKLEIRNYHNNFTAEDEKYIYCIDSYGLYKISKSDSTAKRLIEFDVKNNNYGGFLSLHNNYIYFSTSKNLCRIKKDRSNYYKFSDINQQIFYIKCIGNKLYAIGPKSCCYNIKNEPKELKPMNIYKNQLPNLKDKIYFTHSVNEALVSLYSCDINSKSQKTILNDVDEYLIYNDKIFYYPREYTDSCTTYMCDIDGKSSKPLYKLKNQKIEFLDFDNDWLYIYEPYYPSDNGDGHDYKRINIKTKEVQNLDTISSTFQYRTLYFEIINGFIFSRELGHAKYIKCNGSGEWQNINF